MAEGSARQNIYDITSCTPFINTILGLPSSGQTPNAMHFCSLRAMLCFAGAMCVASAVHPACSDAICSMLQGAILLALMLVLLCA